MTVIWLAIVLLAMVLWGAERRIARVERLVLHLTAREIPAVVRPGVVTRGRARIRARLAEKAARRA